MLFMSISVVIPLYNKAPYVCRALSSVLRQTIQDFECIVVDDGSTDGGGDLVRKMGDRRIRLVRQANGGVSRARNKGINLARHPLIAFLDADDEWLPGFLEANLKIHQEHSNIVASFTNYQQEPDGKRAFCETELGPRVLKDYFAFCLCHQGCGMCSSAVMARRDTLLNIGGFPAGRALGEDLDTWARLAWSGPVALIPDVLSTYHRDASGNQHGTYVDVLPTYELWRDSRRVPLALAASSATYAYFFRFYEVFARIGAQEIDGAKAILSEVPWFRRISVMGCHAHLGLLFPWCQRYVCGVGFRLGCWLLAWRWREEAGEWNSRQGSSGSPCAALR
jgi:glycosyltransferase involved in cell wall biosynthesis